MLEECAGAIPALVYMLQSPHPQVHIQVNFDTIFSPRLLRISQAFSRVDNVTMRCLNESFRCVFLISFVLSILNHPHFPTHTFPPSKTPNPGHLVPR